MRWHFAAGLEHGTFDALPQGAPNEVATALNRWQRPVIAVKDHGGLRAFHHGALLVANGVHHVGENDALVLGHHVKQVGQRRDAVKTQARSGGEQCFADACGTGFAVVGVTQGGEGGVAGRKSIQRQHEAPF